MSDRQFDELEFEEVLFFSEEQAKQKAETEKALMMASAFTAWQLGDKKTTLKKYLKMHGLIESEPELTEEQKSAMTKAALLKAKRIRVAMKRGKLKDKK